MSRVSPRERPRELREKEEVRATERDARVNQKRNLSHVTGIQWNGRSDDEDDDVLSQQQTQEDSRGRTGRTKQHPRNHVTARQRSHQQPSTRTGYTQRGEPISLGQGTKAKLTARSPRTSTSKIQGTSPPNDQGPYTRHGYGRRHVRKEPRSKMVAHPILSGHGGTGARHSQTKKILKPTRGWLCPA